MKIITTHSFRGGTGKTNILANLAYLLAKAGNKVGVVDADATHPSLHIIFGLGNEAPSPTFAEFLLDECKLEDIIFDISKKYGLDSKLFLIPSRLDDTTIYKVMNINQNSFHIQSIFSALKRIGEYKSLDYLLIDTKPELDERILLYILNSQMVFIVCRHDEADIRGTKELLKRLCTIPGNALHIIPSMIDPRVAEEKMNYFRKEFSMFDPNRIKISNPIFYSWELSNEHAPKIDQLFISKYPDDPFSHSIELLAAAIQNQNKK